MFKFPGKCMMPSDGCYLAPSRNSEFVMIGISNTVSYLLVHTIPDQIKCSKQLMVTILCQRVNYKPFFIQQSPAFIKYLRFVLDPIITVEAEVNFSVVNHMFHNIAFVIPCMFASLAFKFLNIFQVCISFFFSLSA